MLLNITWQIFLDMAVLVDAQGELLDNIETQVSQILVICLDYLTALLLLVQINVLNFELCKPIPGWTFLFIDGFLL